MRTNFCGPIGADFLHLKLPEDNNSVCEVDLDFEVFPGVTVESIMANLPDGAGTL